MNFFNKIGNKIKFVLFNEAEIPTTEKERARHEESESRRQTVEHEEAIKSLEKAAEKTLGEMTPDQIDEAEKKRKQAEETRPWGM